MATTTASPLKTPSPTPEGDTPVGVRVVSFLVLAILTIYATNTQHELAELGLAFVTGGTLFLTPELIRVLVRANTSNVKRSSASTTYVTAITLIATILVVLAVVGVGPIRLAHQGLSGARLILVVALFIAEVIVIAGVVPLWIKRWPRMFFSPESLAKGRAWLCQRAHPPLAAFRWVEKNGWFVFLGGALFFVGTILQFIAGA
jgi:magnesium-transporting ATPase (P-type)